MKKNISLYLYTGLLGTSLASTSLSVLASSEAINTCLIEKINAINLDESLEKSLDKTVRELKQECADLLLASTAKEPNKVSSFFEEELQQRNLALEPYAMAPYVMSPHKMNYLLPVSYSDNVNRDAYAVAEGWADNLKSIEIKYQLSFRVPLLTSSLFTEGDGIAFGFTLQSWWQIYAQKISRPFR